MCIPADGANENKWQYNFHARAHGGSKMMNKQDFILAPPFQ